MNTNILVVYKRLPTALAPRQIYIAGGDGGSGGENNSLRTSLGQRLQL